MDTAAGPTSSKELDQVALRALTLATRTAVAMLGPGDEAREVAHDVVVRVLERRAQLRDPEKFDAWVHRIAARETLDVQRRHRRRRTAEHQLGERHETVSTVDLVETIAFSDAARAALDRLGDRERLAMVMHYVHDLSDRQIAAALGCRRGTVNSLLSRARARLRSMPDLQTMTTADMKDRQ